MPYQVSGTDTFVEGDDLHFVNNAAMQQFWDDIRRTVIVGMNTAHMVIEKRLGKEVSPETITNYLETVNHAMPGAAVVQEHMVETNPYLVADSYVKTFTGNDEIADEIDSAYVLNINKMFPEDQAEVLKAEVGDGIWQVVRIPTIVSRTCDGGTTSRWSAMQIGMSMISAYKQAAGEAATGDFAYAAKHAEVVHMGTALPQRRARGENEPGGIPFGFLADICQSSRVNADDPVRVTLDVVASGAMLYDQIWLGSYMSGGVGFTQYATAAYTDNILDDFTYFGKEYVEDKFGMTEAPNTMETVTRCRIRSYILRSRTVRRIPSTLRNHLWWITECIHCCSSSRMFNWFRNRKRTDWTKRMVPINVLAQRTALTSRFLRIRSPGPVWCIQRVLN